MSLELRAPVLAKRLGATAVQIEVADDLLEELWELVEGHALLVQYAHLDLVGDTTPEIHIKGVHDAQPAAHFDALEPDVGRVTHGAGTRAAAHVDVNAVQLHMAPPQCLDELVGVAFRLRDGDVTELFARARDHMARHGIGLEGQPVPG